MLAGISDTDSGNVLMVQAVRKCYAYSIKSVDYFIGAPVSWVQPEAELGLASFMFHIGD